MSLDDTAAFPGRLPASFQSGEPKRGSGMSVLKNINCFGFIQIGDDEILFLNSEDDAEKIYSFFKDRYFNHIGLSHRDFSDLPKILDRIGDVKEKKEYIEEVISYASRMREVFDSAIERRCHERKGALLLINFNVFNSIVKPLHEEKVFLETLSPAPSGGLASVSHREIEAFTSAVGRTISDDNIEAWKEAIQKLKDDTSFILEADGIIKFPARSKHYTVAALWDALSSQGYDPPPFKEFASHFIIEGKKSPRNNIGSKSEKGKEKLTDRYVKIFSRPIR